MTSSNEPSLNRDVVFTGIGLVTPLGLGAAASWQALLNGETAGRLLTTTDIDHFQPLCDLLQRVPGGAPVDHAALDSRLHQQLAADAVGRHVLESFGTDCLNRMMLASVIEALDDADLPRHTCAGDPRMACVIGTSKGSLRAMEQEVQALRLRTDLPQQHWPNSFLPDAPLHCVRQFLNATGPSFCPVAACATGLVSVIQAAALIRHGFADVCVAGSVDASLRASVLAAFHRLGVTSKHTNPATACRPFDRDRDGFVIGEGAAALILESAEHAARRMATTYGRFVGGCWLTDPTGLTQVDTSGGIVREAICRLYGSKRNDTVPDVISLHGTGTPTNDLAEARGIASYYGPSAPPGFGIKGAMGHLLGAAGSVELAMTLLALRHGIIPATAGHVSVDPKCEIPLLQQTRTTPLNSALKLSLGFGGHVAACQIDTTCQFRHSTT
ncbi:MAG: beta-ketoacyl-[acyl-carrier-protein] synthase family protein [Planctomycetaceae bacterium]